MNEFAIGFFTLPEDESALLNQIDAKEKRKLLPDFIRAVQDKSDRWALRSPALEKAAQRKDNVSGYAKGALKQLESKAPPNQGVQK